MAIMSDWVSPGRSLPLEVVQAVAQVRSLGLAERAKKTQPKRILLASPEFSAQPRLPRMRVSSADSERSVRRR